MKFGNDLQAHSYKKNPDQKQIEKKKTFLKIFLGITFGMFLVIFLGFSMVYRKVQDVIIDQNVQMSMQAFSQVQSEFDKANATANMIATQVALDDVCSDFINEISASHLNSIVLNRVRNQLSMYQNTNSSVESIYVYNPSVDLFLTSGSRFGKVGKDDFSDRSVVELMEDPETYCTSNLIRREMQSKYPNQSDKVETVYSYFRDTAVIGEGSVIVVNMKFDSMVQNIVQMEMMKDSRMLIIGENGDRLVDVQTVEITETEPFQETVRKMAEENTQNKEYRMDGERYFISYLYSDKSQWNYVKITKWDTMFKTLDQLQRWMFTFLAAAVLVAVLIALGTALSMLKIHRKLEKRYIAASCAKRSDMMVLREGLLNDFLHGRKLFGKSRLRAEMEKLQFSVQEDQRFAVLILKIEDYDKFCETFGKKDVYDIKYGFQNIFAETFAKEFRSISLINRDDTLTFVVEVKDEETFTEKIQGLFREFCENVKVFVEWEFMLFGAACPVPFERLPEQNTELKEMVSEGFFYPANSFLTDVEILREHGKKADFQYIDADFMSRLSGSDKNVRELYLELAEELQNCKMSDYMNAMTWFGIAVCRNVKQYAIKKQEGDDFLMMLAKCEKASEIDELFLKLLSLIEKGQEKASAKKGVTGKLSEVKGYIEENFSDPNLTLEQLGDEFSVSPNYLGRLFKKEMGVSVSDYINGERMKWALEQLEKTERPAKAIAEECGFVSSNYFYTYFRKKIGVTPQMYREQCREQKKNAESRV